ncbi:MAG TPA: lysylphosphatidylglycerol synthase domain-containing protein [Anaeromyxobacter sp.]
MAARRGGRVPRLRLSMRRAAALLAALSAGALLVALVFFRPGWSGGPTLEPRFALGAFLARLPAHLRWLGPFVALAALLPALRTLVWHELLPRPPPRLADAYHATALGAFVNNAVPGKLGPLAAAWALARMAGRPFAPALSSQLLAKLLELGAIVALGAAAATLRDSGASLARVVVAGAALFALLSSAAVVLALSAPRAAARFARGLPRAGAALRALGDGIVGAGRPARLAAALGLALLPALGAGIAYALPLRAMALPDSATGGALLVAVIAFGQLTPGLPVGAGVYWSLASWAARQLGATAEDAAALAILTHLGMVGAGLAVGAASAVARRATVVELVRRRREVERLADPPTRMPT